MDSVQELALKDFKYLLKCPLVPNYISLAALPHYLELPTMKEKPQVKVNAAPPRAPFKQHQANA